MGHSTHIDFVAASNSCLRQCTIVVEVLHLSFVLSSRKSLIPDVAYDQIHFGFGDNIGLSGFAMKQSVIR